MSNADEPAYPMIELNPQSGPEIFNEGLTKRETFAMNAPKMPDWFKHSKQPKCVLSEDVLSEQEQKDYVQYSRSNYAYDRFDEGKKAHQKYCKISGYHYLEHNKKVYFEWCCFYADGLLEKLQDNYE
jgi:hypothetical protein